MKKGQAVLPDRFILVADQGCAQPQPSHGRQQGLRGQALTPAAARSISATNC
jgi:hypothetical protein